MEDTVASVFEGKSLCPKEDLMVVMEEGVEVSISLE